MKAKYIDFDLFSAPQAKNFRNKRNHFYQFLSIFGGFFSCLSLRSETHRDSPADRDFSEKYHAFF